MKKIILYSWIFICGSLIAQNEEPFKINSGEACYDGKQIVLEGKVDVEHDLGSITAHRLTVQLQPEKKNKFSFLEMSQDVQLNLANKGQLSCQRAEIDYETLIGRCWGDQEQPEVTYCLPPFLELKSHHMQMDLIQEKDLTTKTLIKQIQAWNCVQLHYQKDYLFKAHRALYFPPPQSYLTLFKDSQSPCKILHQNDVIQAQQVDIDIKNQHIHLKTAEGTLKPSNTQTLVFSAEEMDWDQQKHLLRLVGQVNLVQNENLHLFTANEIQLVQISKEGKNKLANLTAHKDTTITCKKNEKIEKIICPGQLTVDNQQCFLIMEGIPDTLQQVYLEGNLGKVYADRAKIEYYWKNKQLVPQKIVLDGNIQLNNRLDSNSEKNKKPARQYLLADHMEYNAESQELLLSANEGQRVLFYDQTNNVQMSAPSLKIRQQAETKKQVIQGIGDVRFTFIEKELEQLKKRFEQDKKS